MVEISDLGIRYARAVAVHRIIVPLGEELGPEGSLLRVEGDEAHHAVRVKRLEVGDAVELLDGRGGRARASIKSIAKHGKHGWSVELAIAKIVREDRARVMVEVYAAAAKGERLEEMVDALSQLGADLFHPLLTERSIVDPREGKLERLRRTALESMKQCGRAWPLEIGEPVKLAEVMSRASSPRVLLCAADATGGEIPKIGDSIERVLLLVGPEGGWSPGELNLFGSSSAALVRCAGNTLRVETAAVAVTTLVVDRLAAGRRR